MTMKKAKWAIVSVIAVGVAVAIIVTFRPIDLLFSCRRVLGNVLYSDFRQYRALHDGSYPSNIAEIENVLMPEQKTVDFATCPAVGRRTLNVDNLEESDYIYVNWGAYFGTNDVPADFPILYDRRLSNHRGILVNVLTAGGHCYSDFRGKRLKEFASKHPEYHLPMPE